MVLMERRVVTFFFCGCALAQVSVWLHFWGQMFHMALLGRAQCFLLLWESVKGKKYCERKGFKLHTFTLLFESPDDGWQNPSQSVGI